MYYKSNLGLIFNGIGYYKTGVIIAKTLVITQRMHLHRDTTGEIISETQKLYNEDSEPLKRYFKV